MLKQNTYFVKCPCQQNYNFVVYFSELIFSEDKTEAKSKETA